MEAWDEEYFNMEGQAYVEVNNNGIGEFQFGLVQGSLNGVLDQGTDRFIFTWEGGDETDEASGLGWLKQPKKSEIEGFLRFHSGDESYFNAQKVD